VLDVVLLLSGPPWAGFSGVVGTACGWCLWLEKASTAGVRRFG